MTKPTGPTKLIAKEIKSILRAAGPMARVRANWIIRWLEITPAAYTAAIDLIQAEGKFPVIRVRGQGATVAMA